MLWNNDSGCVWNTSYYLKSATVIKGANTLTDGAIGIEVLTQSEIDAMNSFIDTNQGSEEIDTTGWRKWKLGTDGTPYFE